MEVERIFIVTHDFTDAAQCALNQALELSNHLNSKIILLHVISKESERESANNKLNKISSENTGGNVNVVSEVVKGSIFKTIGNVAEKHNASAIIMGTHGAKGMQKVFGSFAMKVIISTKVPFMVVQKDTSVKKLNNICFSIDPNSESMQIMNLAGNLAKTYNAKIHIIAEKDSDKSNALKIKNNLIVLSKHMKKLNVSYKLELLDNINTWENTVIQYAKENSIDMFAYSYDSDRFLASNDKFSQALLFNNLKIPALILNAKSISSTYF